MKIDLFNSILFETSYSIKVFHKRSIGESSQHKINDMKQREIHV